MMTTVNLPLISSTTASGNRTFEDAPSVDPYPNADAHERLRRIAPQKFEVRRRLPENFSLLAQQLRT